MLKIYSQPVNVRRAGEHRCALPFSICPLAFQEVRPEEVTKRVDSERLHEKKKHIYSWISSHGGSEFTSGLHAILIGGSLAKGTADHFSDTDLCMVPSAVNIEEYLRVLGGGWVAQQDRHEFRVEVEFPVGNRIDIRVVSLERLQVMVREFQTLSDLSATRQDCLANFQDGIYIKSTPVVEGVLGELEFTYEHARLIALEKLKYIEHYDLGRFLARGDLFTYNEILGMLYAAFCHVFFAVNGRLFRGYRNLSRFSAVYNIYPESLISAFSECFESATPSASENLFVQLLGFKKELEENL